MDNENKNFAQHFATPYYKKAYKDAVISLKNPIPHISQCPDSEKKYMFCKKELKSRGYPIPTKEKAKYFSDTNGFYRVSNKVYFWNIREVATLPKGKMN